MKPHGKLLRGKPRLHGLPLRPCYVVRDGRLRRVRLKTIRRGDMFILVETDGKSLIVGVAGGHGRTLKDGRGEIFGQSWTLVRPRRLATEPKRRKP